MNKTSVVMNENQIEGLVDGKVVISLSKINGHKWIVSSSTCFPSDLLESSYMMGVYNDVFRELDRIKYERGERIRCLLSNKNGTIEFIEPTGKKMWILFDGESEALRCDNDVITRIIK